MSPCGRFGLTEVMEGVVRSSQEVANFIIQYIKELDACSGSSVTYHNISGRWEPPRISSFKVNFDASFDSGNSRSGSGVVIRDPRGRVHASSSAIHQRVGSVFGAETLAFADALKLFVCTGIQSIIVEGDSLSIIKKCRSTSTDRSIISPFIQYIHALLPRFSHVCFQHVNRCKNALADRLAKESLKISHVFYLDREVPTYACAIQMDEAIREPD